MPADTTSVPSTHAVAAATPDFSYCAVGDERGCVMWGPTVGQLIARPELYHGRAIRTIGFLHLEFEGNGLFASREDADHVFGSGLWVDVPDSMQAREAAVNDRYVIVEGRYHGGRSGHMGSSLGRIDSIVRLDVWPSRSELKRRMPAVSR